MPIAHTVDPATLEGPQGSLGVDVSMVYQSWQVHPAQMVRHWNDGAAGQVAVTGAQLRCLPAFGVARL